MSWSRMALITALVLLAASQLFSWATAALLRSHIAQLCERAGGQYATIEGCPHRSIAVTRPAPRPRPKVSQ